ncbi:MAG: hypothetical protein ACRCZF_19085, partial [Gemmataceae bacterium]
MSGTGPGILRVAIVGPPGCGKSSLCQAIVAGEPRLQCHEQPGGQWPGIAPRPADAVLLLLDATQSPAAQAEQLRTFRRVLESFEEKRVESRAVCGLPVFLVLTKCDVLPPGTDLQGCRDFWQSAFQNFTIQPDDEPGFGCVNLHTAAISSQTGQGVRELALRTCAAAEQFQDQTRAAQRSLRFLSTGLAILFSIMILTVALGLSGALAPTPRDPFFEAVEAFLNTEGPPEWRYAAVHFTKHRQQLDEFLAHPGFALLPAGYQSELQSRDRESHAYQAFARQLAPPTLSPADARSPTELQLLQTALAGPFQVPAEWQSAWGTTEAARLVGKWRTEVELLRLVEIRWHDWYRGLIRQAAALETENPLELRWAGSFQQLVESEKQTPTPTDGLIPGSVPLPIPRGTPLTYRVLADYDRITVARNDWHHARDRLLALSELAQALQGGPLDFTGVPRTPAERLQRFPPAEVQARWVVDRFSGAARQQLLARMVEQRERAITQALKHLPGP